MAKFGEEIKFIKESFRQQESATDKVYFIVTLPFKTVLFVFMRGFSLLEGKYFEKKPAAKRRARKRRIHTAKKIKNHIHTLISSILAFLTLNILNVKLFTTIVSPS